MTTTYPPKSVLGIDIGGANLKLADQHGRCLAASFPMWTDRHRLADCLRELVCRFGVSTSIWERVAITMTGEMADCFPTRRDGVCQILDQLEGVFPQERIQVYAVGGDWLSPPAARENPWSVAASNWHALASWILQAPNIDHHDLRLIVDIGSTTVDVIPVSGEAIATQAKTDRERLELRQLVYTGTQRTPVAAILSQVLLDGQSCPLVAEKFAIADDAYLVLGLTPENSRDCETADGRARTICYASTRLARMIGEDAERLSQGAIKDLAKQVIDAQAARIADAITRNVAADDERLPVHLLISGHGRALAHRLPALLPFATRFSWLDEQLSPSAARCAPALAVAWLLANRQAVSG